MTDTTPATTLPDLTDETAWPNTLLDQLRVATLTEQERRQRITDLPAQAFAMAASYQAALGPDPTPVPWDGSTAGYGPGAVVTYQGHTWVNQSGAFLNGSYVPGDAAHPFWSQQPDPAETPTPWATGMHLTPGLLVSNGGELYRYAGVDTASAPVNWAPTGTTSTAAWTYVGPA